MSHTPAPWGFGSIDDIHIGICTKDKDGNWLHLADIDDLSECEIPTPDADTRMANARLIAAAPELLSALQAMVAEYGEFYGDTPEVAAQYQSPLIKSALQAIAKAKGGQP